jgi:hypothetical protein
VKSVRGTVSDIETIIPREKRKFRLNR